MGLVGCGDDGGETVDPDPDSGPIATTVALQVFGSEEPVVLAYRDEGGAWQDLPPNPDGEYSLRVHGAYEVIAVCGSATNYSTQLQFGTPAEGEQSMLCFTGGNSDEPPVATTRVTGTMTQPGIVTFNHQLAESMTGPWTFELDVPSGEAGDLFAHDNERVVVRRNLAVAASIADIDLTAGQPFTKTPVLVDGRLADEDLSTDTYLFAEHGSLVVIRPGSTVVTVPDALLEQFDFQYSYIYARTPTTERDHAAEGAARVELLPRLEGVSFDANGASWTTLPAAGDEATLSVTTQTASVSVSATKGWLDGRTRLALPADLPASVPSGALPAADAVRSFAVSADATRSTRVYESAPTPRQISDGERRLRAALAKAKLRD